MVKGLFTKDSSFAILGLLVLYRCLAEHVVINRTTVHASVCLVVCLQLDESGAASPLG